MVMSRRVSRLLAQPGRFVTKMSPNSPPSLIAGTRVYLRHPGKNDVDEFTRLVIASRHFLHPWIAPASTPEAFARYLRYTRRESVCACLVCRSEDLRIIGVCNLSQIFRGNLKSAYLGYWVGATFSGQGYMTEALGLLLSFAFGSLRLHRIEANIQPENANSKALVTRIGFRKEGFSPRYLKVAGRWKDHERWAICREDWAERLRRQCKG
jgi:[ribosomal protein S5]-alanine N-acetyltransferase